MKKLSLTVIAMLLMVLVSAQNEARLMRFPTIHGNQIVFTYAGDLYSVDKTGGMARKLTNDENSDTTRHPKPPTPVAPSTL